ncbi:neuronal acetylcholine receptor subunit alpha-10-like [Dendronephthya gigantea]|uniref:neuronal acetylcholine receptor subunit alpha-10-like n=1 Tax=Dendronephthya gigantea TaxID=151771 RepID=UPI001069F2FD|nr:neuronal acetylcholine receptor subunit alpha-10-like [Dendronephthya gigantea]
MYLLLFCFVCYLGTMHFCLAFAERTFDAKVRLAKMLLKDYSKEARPVLDVRDNVSVTVGISLYLIRNMDDKNQMLTTSLWVRQTWYDHRFTWTPSNFSNVKRINMHASDVWVPDIKVYNEVNRGKYSGLDQFQTRIIVDNDGRVRWMGPSVLRTSCQVDIKMFPFDSQTCRIKIGSWTYDGFTLDVIPESYTMDISKSPSSLEWELVTTTVERKVQFYPCCPEPYPDVTYTVTLKRRQKSYGVNFIFPAVFLTGLTIMAFVTRGERIGLVLTCLVSMFFFLKMVAERTPTSDTVPILSIYFVMLSFEVTLIFYAVCITLNAHHRQTPLNIMSEGVRGFVIQKLGCVWGMTSIGNDIKEKLETLHAIANTAKDKCENFEELRSIDRSINKDCMCRCSSEQTNGRVATIHAERTQLKLDESEMGNSENEATRSTITDSSASSGSQVNIDPEKHRTGNSNVTTEKLAETVHKRSLDDAMDAGVNMTMKIPREHLNLQNQAPHYCQCESCLRKPGKARCVSFINDMIVLNQRLVSDIQEINYLARNWEYRSSQKRHWLTAATTLDRGFLILFLLMFITLTVCNFIW